ncbi:MAG: sulfatase-like hydrolase/transferase [Deltaproteobacteria bacterium]|nr:sulfatase-like hydrolase/transferase [Deltaproteobacteria bacterium]
MVFIFSFRQQIDNSSTWRDVGAVLLNGVRFDSMVAGYFILIPFLFTLSCNFADMQSAAENARAISGNTFIVLSTALCGITLGYFKEYNDQINHFIFGIYYDDPQAILTTIWKEYRPILSTFLMGLVILIGLSLKGLFMGNFQLPDEAIILTYSPSAIYRIIMAMMSMYLVFVGTRGSLGARPTQRHDAFVTKDEFLNKVVFNPYLALRYAVKDQRRISGKGGLKVFLPDEDIVKAAKLFFSKEETLGSLDDYMLKHAKGPRNKPPRHIFLVVMESYDAWPMLEKYASLGLTPRLLDLAGKGLNITSFLPSSSGTMSSLSAIISGLPDAGLETNLQKSASKPYPSSIAEAFKGLGYRTRFFYGGRLGWRRVDDFCRAQGFEEIYGASHIGDWVSTNEWGVDDEHLFDFVAKNVNDDQPSLNLILTTGYHPPFSVDVYGKGFHLNQVPDDLKEVYDNSVDLKILGHLWYSDKSLGDFVEAAEKKLPMSLFAITGDHFGRRFINPRPDMFERSSVPLVLYGKDVLKDIRLPDGTAGSHIDIGPTLVELSAPKDFIYYSVGKDLLLQQKTPLGFGRGKVIGPDFIADLSGTPRVYPLPEKKLPDKLPDMEELKLLHNDVHGISWWRIKKGSELS